MQNSWKICEDGVAFWLHMRNHRCNVGHLSLVNMTPACSLYSLSSSADLIEEISCVSFCEFPVPTAPLNSDQSISPNQQLKEMFTFLYFAM